MTTVHLSQLDLAEFVGIENPKQHCKASFPLLGMHGTKHLATVYFEIAPGDHLGRHTDSAEELLIVLSGEVEITVADETAKDPAGTLALVPKMAAHNITNIGDENVRVLGVFGGANNIVATFDKDWLPTHSNVVDTATLA